MKKKISLLFSIIAFCLALSSLMLGVFALNTITYTISGSMEYNVDYPLLDITTTVYKYEGKPLTPEQGQEYLKKYSQLTPVPELGQHYTTVDENGMALETVEEKTLEMDVKYADCSAYYIAVKVVSYATGMAVGATVTSEVVGENTWDANTGDAVILKGATGKTIVFGFGLNKTQKSSNGYFDFNIVFEYLDDYEIEGGQINYSIPNFSPIGGEVDGGTIIAQESFEETIPVEMNITQMIPDGDSELDLTNPENVDMYGAIVYVGASGFSSESNITFRLQNPKFYDQNDNPITYGTMHMFVVIDGKMVTSIDEVYADYLTLMANLGVDNSCSVDMVADTGKDSVATLLFGFTNKYNTYDEPYVYTVEFDLVVEYNIEPAYFSFDYEYRYEVMADGNAMVIPGSLQNPSANITGSPYVDVFVPRDYVVEVSMTIEEAMMYLASSGRQIPSEEYLPAYMNSVVWTQIMMLIFAGESYGAIPVPKEDFTFGIEGVFSYTFKKVNWFKDMMLLTMLFEQVFENDETLIGEFLMAYYMPAPTDMSEYITVPIHMYRLENTAIMFHYMAAMYSYVFPMQSGITNFGISLLVDFLQVFIKMGLWMGDGEPSAVGLPDNYTDADVLFVAYAMYVRYGLDGVLTIMQQMSSTLMESEMATMGFSLNHYIIMPGETYPIGGLVTGLVSDFYTGLPKPAAAVANTNKEQSNNVYNFDVLKQMIVDRKKQYALVKED